MVRGRTVPEPPRHPQLAALGNPDCAHGPAICRHQSSGQGDPAGWTQLSPDAVAANLLYMAPFTGHDWLNGILLTLSVEFQYYLFLALAFPLFARHPYWIAAAGIALLGTALLPFAEQAMFLKYAVYFTMGGLVLLYREARIGPGAMLAELAIMTMVAGYQLE